MADPEDVPFGWVAVGGCQAARFAVREVRLLVYGGESDGGEVGCYAVVAEDVEGCFWRLGVWAGIDFVLG